MLGLLPAIRLRGPATVAQFSMRYHLAIPSPPERERARVRGSASLGLKRVKPRQRHPTAHQHLDQGRPKEHEPEGASRSQETREEESARSGRSLRTDIDPTSGSSGEPD